MSIWWWTAETGNEITLWSVVNGRYTVWLNCHEGTKWSKGKVTSNQLWPRNALQCLFNQHDSYQHPHWMTTTYLLSVLPIRSWGGFLNDGCDRCQNKAQDNESVVNPEPGAAAPVEAPWYGLTVTQTQNHESCYHRIMNSHLFSCVLHLKCCDKCHYKYQSHTRN